MPICPPELFVILTTCKQSHSPFPLQRTKSIFSEHSVFGMNNPQVAIRAGREACLGILGVPKRPRLVSGQIEPGSCKVRTPAEGGELGHGKARARKRDGKVGTVWGGASRPLSPRPCPTVRARRCARHRGDREDAGHAFRGWNHRTGARARAMGPRKGTDACVPEHRTAGRARATVCKEG